MTRFCDHVVMFATADWTSRYWTNSQHTAVELAARGYRVLFVETVGIRRPSINVPDLARMFRRIAKGLSPIQAVQPNIWVLAPLTIPGAHWCPVISAFNERQLRRRVSRWLSEQRAEHPVVWTYHPFMLDVANALEPAATVYHCVDDIGALPGVDRAHYARAERLLLERATHVFATSLALRDRCASVAPARTHYFANVADVEHFASARRAGAVPADLAGIPRPRIGYVGALSDFKLDLHLLEAAVRKRNDWHWVFIGDEREGQSNSVLARLRTRSNVHMMGWRPYAALPEYLRGIDVAILPQQLNDYTRAMFPMKFFEYLAAGRPIVATPLPALDPFRGLFRSAATAEELIQEISAALADPAGKLLPIDDPILREHSWGARLTAMLALVEGRAAKRES
jgi:glycosyltransferase involved in cell wall biosynthesis